MPESELFKKTQYNFAAHLQDPEKNPAPADIEDRRMKIYRELIYNNIESFLSNGFPILRSLLDETSWHEMVRDFIRSHTSQTPYFLEISQEFLRYLQEERGQEERGSVAGDLPFMLELAHYEWVELALDVSPEEFDPEVRTEGDLLAGVPVVSPLAWRLSYQYPVHMIGPDFQPQHPPEQPTFLVVYRNRQQEVKFLEVNAVTTRLLQLFEQQHLTGEQALEVIASEMQHPDPAHVIESGRATLQQLLNLGIIAGLC